MTLARALPLTIALIFLTSINLHGAETADNENPAAEIEHLLQFVGDSRCVFNRNGGQHEATEAESHLRMKYGKGKRYVSSAEQFISRIASESSWSGRAYTVDCPDRPTQPSRSWLTEELERYRAARDLDRSVDADKLQM